MNATLDEIRNLSVAERIQLVEDIWDSIAAAPETLELSDTQKSVLDERLNAHRKNPDAARSWADLHAQIQSS